MPGVSFLAGGEPVGNSRDRFMEKTTLKELNFHSRNEALSFLKRLWQQQETDCPICGCKLELLHKKAKKSDCDWQCKNCNKAYRTVHLLDELNEQMPN